MTADLKNAAQKALDAYDKYESHRDALQFAAAIESLRKAVELQAPAEAHGEIVAWMYEHDGCNDEPILTVDRWPECREPWNETPLDVLALAKHAIEKVWLDAVCTDHGEHSISEAARTRVEFAADALMLGLRLTGVKPSAVPAPRIGKWGHCWTCNHDASPGEGCARSQCPMLAAKTVPEPAWYAVTSLRAPCIDKVIRRLDVAEEYADKQREVWTDVEIVPLYTQPVPVADKPGARFIEKTNREYIAWCKTKYIPESLDERGMKSLDGLWAWQAQEHRYATQSNPQPKGTATVRDGWKHDCAALLTNDVELWVDRCPHCGKPAPAAQAPAPGDGERDRFQARFAHLKRYPDITAETWNYMWFAWEARASEATSAPAVAHQPETAMPADNTFNTALLKLQEISAEAGAVKGYWPGDSDRIERVVKLANEVIEVLMQAPSGDFTHEEYIALTNPGALKPLEVGFGSQESQPPVQHKEQP